MNIQNNKGRYMAKRFYETDAFITTQKEWYKKLKDDGFNDIETAKQTKTNSFDKQTIQVDPKAILYMSLCENYLRTGKITNKLDLFIFEKHVDGLNQQQTAELLVGNKLRKLSQQAVSLRIANILKIAGITPFEFNSKRK